MFESSGISPENALLDSYLPMGNAADMADKIFEMIGHAKFFEDFTQDDVNRLASFMEVYQVKPGGMIIREGDVDDYMLFIIEGRVNILKRDTHGENRTMTIAGPGTTLGEMSMIDGEPRFASCIALDQTTFAVLSRQSMVEIIVDQPAFGSKVLIKLITLLSQRLRATSTDLVHYIEYSQSNTV